MNRLTGALRVAAGRSGRRPGRRFWLIAALALLAALAVRAGWAAYLPDFVQRALVGVAAVTIVMVGLFGISVFVVFWIVFLVWRGLRRIPRRSPRPPWAGR